MRAVAEFATGQSWPHKRRDLSGEDASGAEVLRTNGAASFREQVLDCHERSNVSLAKAQHS